MKTKLKSCLEFGSAFVTKFEKEAQGFDKVRVIPNRYTKESLKSGTRTTKTEGEIVRFKISDDTVIEHLTTKQFLSDIKTKQGLTKYLSMKLYNVFKNVVFAASYLTTKQFLSDIKTKQGLTKYLSMKLYNVFKNVVFAASYEFTCISKISDIDARLKDYCHEEADTCIVLHSLDVTKRNLFTDLAVHYYDTDVLLLSLYYFDGLCSSTIFRTTNCDIRLRTLHS